MCNDPAQTSHAESDGYIAAFTQYMTEKLGKNWRTSTPVEALVAMADPACRDQFAGELKHMVMGMGRDKNEFVKAKQSALVLSSYVQDRRTLKRKSHVSVILNATAGNHQNDYYIEIVKREGEVWENAKISLNPGSGQLTATSATHGSASANRASPPSDEQLKEGAKTYEALLADLDSKEKKQAQKTQLIKSVVVEGKGNAIKIIGWA